jgi:hypothetical protein
MREEVCMNRALRSVLVAVLAVGTALATSGLASADINNSTGTNVQSGDNRSTTNQSGASKSGDAVGGQVTGVVSSGRTSVDARNTSSNSDVTSGDARGGNTADSFTGLNSSAGGTSVGPGAADINGTSALNLQDGDNRSTINQTASYTTGDGVAGEVIGVVTAAGGSASIVAANTSTDDSVTTGDARGGNDAAAFTGINLSEASGTAVGADITNSCNFGPELGCANEQSGTNRTTVRQVSTASTGDGVAGQVIGDVSGGASSIDARNTSDNVDVTTGDARTDNAASAFDGLNASSASVVVAPGAADISGTCQTPSPTPLPSCGNVQDGDNTTTANQSASATTGDGVGGQVIGAVTSAGGSASIVAANTSTDSDITTGDAHATNDLAAFVGQNFSLSTLSVVASDVIDSCTTTGCGNVQSGDNRLTGTQSATSTTGDGVGGQVLGVVSAGAASLDASNTTTDSSVTTGDSHAANSASEIVGLNFAPTTTVGTADVSSATAVNVQDGTNRKNLTQSANATSGDAVAGQVSGVVTSAGGSASVVLANTSNTIDATSGDTHFDNTDAGFVGLNDSFAGAVTIP